MANKNDKDNADLMLKLNNWLNWDKNNESRSYIEKLSMDMNNNMFELEELLSKRMEFGTAGLRSEMKPGFSYMNDLTIIQTSQGLSQYAHAILAPNCEANILIGYDCRNNSRRFAHLAALAFLSNGFKVLLFDEVVPTPYVAFGTIHMKCLFGIMITASHNPKNDNGYKVYASNGAQINTPVDKYIQQSILKNLEPWQNAWNLESIKFDSNVFNPLDKIQNVYESECIRFCFQRDLNPQFNARITYTALHGVGAKFVKKIFAIYQLHELIDTQEQSQPDGNFPTVKFPNPEEGKSSLDLAMCNADKNNSNFIIANDPDADRLCFAEKHDNQWLIFNGNDIGTLLAWWIIFNFKKSNCSDNKLCMVRSVVSSNMLDHMCHVEGIRIETVLTGFKWIGNEIIKLKQDGYKCLFAFEEAIGYLCGDYMYDKDGVCTAAVASEMYTYLKQKGVTLHEKLLELHQQYGLHLSFCSYLFSYDPSLTMDIFKRIRIINNGQYPTKIGDYSITRIVDLFGDGYDSSTLDNKPTLPVSKSSQLLTFYLDQNKIQVTLRTSGTEPKIKFYGYLNKDIGEMMLKSFDDSSIIHSKKLLNDVVELIIDQLLQPSLNKLTRKNF